MRLIALATALLLFTGLLLADEHNVDFDHHTDFRTFKTFALREGKVTSREPELNNPLLVRKIGAAIRAALKAKGLKETVITPDLIVNYRIDPEDSLERRGGPPDLSRGTLVIDLLKRESHMMVWRGVYRDDESNNARLAQKLPGDAKKSLSEFPPKQQGIIEPAAPSFVTKENPDPRSLAKAVIEIVQSTREDRSYVGPNAHPGLDANLNQLERAARAAAANGGRNRADINTLTKAIQETADYALSIANRPSEDPDSKTKSRNLAAQLRGLL